VQRTRKFATNRKIENENFWKRTEYGRAENNNYKKLLKSNEKQVTIYKNKNLDDQQPAMENVNTHNNSTDMTVMRNKQKRETETQDQKKYFWIEK